MGMTMRAISLLASSHSVSLTESAWRVFSGKKGFRDVRKDLDHRARSNIVAVNVDDRRSTPLIEHVPDDSFKISYVIDYRCGSVEDFNLLFPCDEEDGSNLIRVRLINK